MTREHVSSTLPLKNKVIPVDSNTVLLAHYDLNGNDVLTGLAPEAGSFFSLTSNGYYGGGVTIEDYTTNLWTGDLAVYNNFGVPATFAPTGEIYQGAPVWRLGMTVDSAHSANLVNFQTELGNHGVVGGSMSWVQDVMYASSIYWKPVNKLDTIFGGIASNTAGWVSGTNEILPDGWRRYYRYRTGAGVATKTDSVHHSFYCPSLQLNETIYIDVCCPQTEQGRKFPTSYTSTTRNASVLRYKLSISPNLFTINFWAKVTGWTTYGFYLNLYPGTAVDGNNRAYLRPATSTSISGGRMVASTVTSMPTIAMSPIESWHMYTWTSNGSTMKVYQDGVLINISSSITQLPSQNVCVLELNGGSTAYSTIFDELRVDKIERSEDEILAWYYSNSPFWPKGIYKVSY